MDYLLLFFDTEAACPTGWDSVESGCYKFTQSSSGQDAMSYSEASSSCAAISGKLVVFNSYDEMLAVGDTYSGPYIAAAGAGWMWIGCTDQDEEGTFECEDGTQVNSGKLQRVYRRLSLIRSFMGG